MREEKRQIDNHSAMYHCPQDATKVIEDSDMSLEPAVIITISWTEKNQMHCCSVSNNGWQIPARIISVQSRNYLYVIEDRVLRRFWQPPRTRITAYATCDGKHVHWSVFCNMKWRTPSTRFCGPTDSDCHKYPISTSFENDSNFCATTRDLTHLTMICESVTMPGYLIGHLTYEAATPPYMLG